MKENTLCNTISALRRASGMTQEQLAQRLGISYQAVSKWENGLSCPDVLLLPDIAEIFGVSLDRLFGVETAPSESAPVPLAPVQPGALPWPDDDNYYAVLYQGHRLRAYNQPPLRLEGDLESSLTSCFPVECGDVGGSVNSSGDVTCDDVGGSVNAGGDVTCNDVGGNVSAGGDVTCDDVDGSVSAGGDVECGDVGGKVTAMGDLDCGDIHNGGDAGEKAPNKRKFSFHLDGDSVSEIQKSLKDMKTELGQVLKGVFEGGSDEAD